MMMHLVEKALMQSVVTGGATCLYFGMEQLAQVPYIGETKLCYVGAGVGLLASIANDMIHSFVLEEIPINKKAEEEAAMVVAVGTGALVYHFGLSLVNPALAADTGLVANCVIGGGSELASSFAYNLLRG